MSRAMIAAAVLICCALPHQVTADSTDVTAVGWADADGDGRNDLFRDADGDGKCDVTGRAYAHHFAFEDEDEDGRNDGFRDADGDGVNDLDGAMVDGDDDGRCDNVIDADGDHRNDITGQKYDEELGGWRFGRIDEMSGEETERFLDRDGDGMHDPWQERGPMSLDLFIDEDGDGIADGRAVRGRIEAGPGMAGHGERRPAGVHGDRGSRTEEDRPGRGRRGRH